MLPVAGSRATSNLAGKDEEVVTVAVLRTLLGEALRTTRLGQERTLREVSSAAQVSLGYLSEVERGQKEASSELLASICRALGVRLSDVLREVSESLSVLEPQPAPVQVPDTIPAGMPALEPVGADGPAAELRASVRDRHDVVAAA